MFIISLKYNIKIMNNIFINYKNFHNCVYRVLVFLIVVIFFYLLFLSDSVMATQTPSWSKGEPIVFSSSSVGSMPSSLCQKYFRYQNVAGVKDAQKFCMQDGITVSYGARFMDSSFYSAISFANDSKMYKIHGVCQKYDSCIYIDKTDTLITKQHIINGIVRSLVVYNNFTSRLDLRFNSATLANEYYFDSSNPDYIFKSSSGYAWPIGGFALSDNGKWLAIEFRQRGIGVLDLENLNMRLVSNTRFSYDIGMNPSVELAINNNGSAVAVMGANAGFSIFDIDDNCGYDASDEIMQDTSKLDSLCKKSPVVMSKIIDRFYMASHPRFTEDGWGLDFFANSVSGGAIEVSLRASDSSVEKLDYLALGDSFSSGEGEFDDSFYLPGTNEESEKCHVSSRSYPFLLAGMSGLSPDLVKSVACSGARTVDVVGSQDSYNGQGNRLVSGDLGIQKNETLLANIEAKIKYIPGRVLQSSFVQNNKPKIVTVGIGGNDVGIVDKLKSCIGLDTCSWVTDLNKRQQFGQEIRSLQGVLEKTYQEIHDVSPGSKIFAVSYPRPIDFDGVCSDISGVLLNKDERRLLGEAVLYINQIIKASTLRVGIGYLDIQESYGSQAMCGGDEPFAVNGLVSGDDVGLGWLKFIGNESFHPNPVGHQLTADFIYANVGDIGSYNYCENNATICPKLVTTPELSDYWGKSDNLRALKSYNYASKSEFFEDEAELSINLPKKSFQPNSKLRLEINSDPITIGEYSADDFGGFNVETELPKSIDYGYHTLILYGTSFSGEGVDLYQIIKYQKKDTIDLVSLKNDEVDLANSELEGKNDDVVDLFNNQLNSLTIKSDVETQLELAGASTVLVSEANDKKEEYSLLSQDLYSTNDKELKLANEEERLTILGDTEVKQPYSLEVDRMWFVGGLLIFFVVSFVIIKLAKKVI